MATKINLIKDSMYRAAKAFRLDRLPLVNPNDFGKHDVISHIILQGDEYTLYRISTISKGYINYYWLEYNQGNYNLIVHWDMALFVLDNVTNVIKRIIKDEVEYIGYDYSPTIKVYSSFKIDNGKFILQDPSSVDIKDLSEIEYTGLPASQKKIVKQLGNINNISKILHTPKTLKYMKTGRQPETYFHETAGKYYPGYQSDDVSKRYKYHETFIATEAWCAHKHADVRVDEAPEPTVDIYNKRYNQITNKYIKGDKIASVKLTQDMQQNLVSSVQNSNMLIFDVDNIKIETNDLELLFPVKYTPISYAEHNRRHNEALNELHIWLMDNLGEYFEENVYEDIKQYIEFNTVAPINKIGRVEAIRRCLKLKQYASYDKAYLAAVELSSTPYICLFKYERQGILLIHAIPYRNHSTYYENYGTKEDKSEYQRKKEISNNQEIKSLAAADEMYNEYIVKSPMINKGLVDILKKLI